MAVTCWSRGATHFRPDPAHVVHTCDFLTLSLANEVVRAESHWFDSLLDGRLTHGAMATEKTAMRLWATTRSQPSPTPSSSEQNPAISLAAQRSGDEAVRRSTGDGRVLADDETLGVDAKCDRAERRHGVAGGVRSRDVERNPC
jgi:hypothetical protein